MSRPKPEVADVFRVVTPKACFQHDGQRRASSTTGKGVLPARRAKACFQHDGPACRRENARHLNLPQLKVMSTARQCIALQCHERGPSRPAGSPRPAVMLRPAASVATNTSPAPAVATGIARSAKGLRRGTGCRRASRICCRSNTSTWSSPCRRRSRTSRIRMSHCRAIGPSDTGECVGLRPPVQGIGSDPSDHRCRSRASRRGDRYDLGLAHIAPEVRFQNNRTRGAFPKQSHQRCVSKIRGTPLA